MAKQNFGDSIKQAKIYADTLDAINKKTEAQNKNLGFLAQEMGIAYGGFIQQVEKSNALRREEARLAKEAKSELDKIVKSASDIAKETLGINEILDKTANQSEVFAKTFANIDVSGLNSIEEVEKRILELQEEGLTNNQDNKDEFDKLVSAKKAFYKEEEKENDRIKEDLEFQIKNNDLLRDILEQQGVQITDNKNLVSDVARAMENSKDVSDSIATSQHSTLKDREKFAGLSDRIVDSEREFGRASEVASNSMRDQIGFAEKLQGFIEKSGDSIRKDIWKSMKDFDQAISDAGKNFGFVDMKSYTTSKNMQNLGQSAARFGVSMKDAIGLMGAMGDELSTIDQNYLANSVEHFMAIEKATGISSEEISTIAGEMMRAGKSAEDVENYMEGANKMAKRFGVNTKKVLQGVARNIDKMRQMGFQGGEESLTRMVATAERLRMNVDEIFDMSSKARSIEGAMDMAAELQLAGGSFANIDPMSLLAAARKGPEELQKILTQMGGDIGNFNKETGELEFDAIDADRLQMMADATGVSVDSMQKMLQKQAQDAQKMDFMPDMQLGPVLDADGKELDQDMLNNMLLDAVDVNGDAIEGGLLDEAGVSSLEDLTAEQAQSILQEKMNKEASLAEQAEQNQSFSESIQAFKDAIMNMFVVFEPFIKMMTTVVQAINKMPGPIKGLIAAFIGFVAIAPKLAMAMDGMKKGFGMMKGVLGKIKGVFGMGKDAAGAAKGGQDALAGQINDTAKGGGDVQKAKGSGGGLQSLAEGLKAMGNKKVFAGIGAIALAGPALLLMLPGIPTILAMGLVGLMGPTVELGFKSLANGIAYMGNAKGIWKGLAVMALVGLALIPFALAANMMVGVDWLSVLAGIGVLSLVVLGLIMMGTSLAGPQLLFLLYAVGILVLIGASLLIFGIAMQQFAMGAQMMQGMDFSWLSGLGWALFEAAPGLFLGGLAIAAVAPLLMVGSMGLLALGVAATMLSAVDWEAFGQIGDALMNLVPGLLGFSLAGLMFVNPITLLGMILMMSTLAGLAAVMVPLSESLGMGADGLDRFADGLAKLQEAANSLDLEKLDALRSLAWSMAIAGIGGGMLGAQIDQIAEALAKLSNAGGGGKGGGTQKIQVDLKLNGRDLQSIIVDDTEVVS